MEAFQPVPQVFFETFTFKFQLTLSTLRQLMVNFQESSNLSDAKLFFTNIDECLQGPVRAKVFFADESFRGKHKQPTPRERNSD